MSGEMSAICSAKRMKTGEIHGKEQEARMRTGMCTKGCHSSCTAMTTPPPETAPGFACGHVPRDPGATGGE